MEESTTRADAAALLAERSWVRRVARALVRDDARSDDLEQSVWLRALERPREVRSPRAWLGTALRNAAADLFRRDDRRRRREEAAARVEAAPAADEAVARAEALRRAVDAALALHEPYRTVVVLRFFEDLAPPAIAERLGVPLETVRTRLRRALEMLRARLDDEHGGDRRAWLALLLPLAGRGPFPGLPAAPAAPAERGAWSGADAAFRAADATFREGLAMTAKAAFAAGLGTAFAVGAAAWLLASLATEDGAPAPKPPSPGFPAAAHRQEPGSRDIPPGENEVTYFDRNGNPMSVHMGPADDFSPEIVPRDPRIGDVKEWAKHIDPRELEELAKRFREAEKSREWSHPDYSPKPGKTSDFPVDRPGSARIEGVVVEEDGTPVRGRVVVIAEDQVAADAPAMAKFDVTRRTAVVRPDGSFVIKGLGENPVTVRAWGEDYILENPAGPIRPGDRVEIRVVRGAAIVGRAVDLAEGDHRRVLLYASQDGRSRGFATVAPDGSFQVRALKPGTVRLEAALSAAPGQRFLLGEFTAPSMEVEVRLKPVLEGTGGGR